jgi:hypothetical protein
MYDSTVRLRPTRRGWEEPRPAHCPRCRAGLGANTVLVGVVQCSCGSMHRTHYCRQRQHTTYTPALGDSCTLRSLDGRRIPSSIDLLQERTTEDARGARRRTTPPELAPETADSTVTMKGMTVQNEAAEVLAVVERACSFFPPASEPAKQLQAAAVRVRAIAEAAAMALTPATERACCKVSGPRSCRPALL